MISFHPIIQQWFGEKYGEPTDIQQQSWPKIADRENLLITAPTGSGKTLTAFLWTLNRFITGDLETGKTRGSTSAHSRHSTMTSVRIF
ncbi:MAG: DEAD/DEAH box helicase [Gammaproteobacteria bacterium]|nr:DEAD/DEAH box helicase [Gammaproteobacteria bacterium]